MSLLIASDLRPALRLAVAEPVIQLERVSVRYRVPHERITSFKEFAIRWLKRQVSYRDVWALRDVSLEVGRGEVTGIVGANGAGKSTLLKVIARVLHPTNGRVLTRGRVAPLLELGAGFDYELTGRENIYLNGAILGYSRRLMDRKVDGITDFAGLGEFIDVPLRTYSSGMIARLGFAVASDVDPDILIVDEALSVGDEAFQRKCLDRLDAFRWAGVTILLVSHNADIVRSLCGRATWLDRGLVRATGPADEVVAQYRLASRL